MSSLQLLKREARITWHGTPVGLSACWSIQEAPQVQIQRRRPWNDFNGKPSWMIVSQRMISYKAAQQDVKDANLLFAPGSDWHLKLQSKAKHLRKELMESQDLADRLAVQFEDKGFSSREEALQSVEGWLLSQGLTT